MLRLSPHATAFTAGQQVLWGDLYADLGIAVDTQPVRDGLCSTECLWAEQPRRVTDTHIHWAGSLLLWLQMYPFVYDGSSFNTSLTTVKIHNKQISHNNLLRQQYMNHHQYTIIFFLTQQDPQEPWSLISFRVGQLGHCSLESKFLGSSRSPAYWTLQRKRVLKTQLLLWTTTVTTVHLQQSKHSILMIHKHNEKRIAVFYKWDSHDW